MHYPSFSEYTDALKQGLGIALSDPLLREGTLRMRAPGQPAVHGGTYALTFEVLTGSGKYAIRCFHKELDSLQVRYEAIVRHLDGIRSSHFVECQFRPKGITTESGTYPLLRMEWAEGPTLADFVAANRRDARTLLELRFALRRLAKHLLARHVAHGDIQPSNIIVQDDMHLRVVDYDGLFVPGLAPLCSAELGQRNFQHPGRRSRHFNDGLDAFPFAVLDVALHALSVRPELWESTASGEDAFLFRAADFVDPAHSFVFSSLAGDSALERRARDLAALCDAPFEAIPPFEQFVEGRGIPVSAIELQRDLTVRAMPPYLSSTRVVDAADFAQCCKHVGDRVELVGRVARVVLPATDGSGDGDCMRVEFGDDGCDIACLKIWEQASSHLESVPDSTWVGTWLSAVGLVEPVSEPGEDGQRKDVSVTITQSGQLQRLTETEARHRLQSRHVAPGRSPEEEGTVRTDPVTPPTVLRPSEPVEEIHAAEFRPAAVAAEAVTPVVPVAADADGTPVTPGAPTEPVTTVAPAAAAAPGAPEARVDPVAAVAPVAAGATNEGVARWPPASNGATEIGGRTTIIRRSPLPTLPPPPWERARSRRRGRWTWWVAAAGIAGLVAYFAIPRDPRPASDPSGVVATESADSDRRESVVPEREAVAENPEIAAERVHTEARVPPAPIVPRFISAESLANPKSVPTVAGALSVLPGEAGRCSYISLDGGDEIPGLCADRIEFAHRAVYTDGEVILGFARCSDPAAPCSHARPFWLVMRGGAAPELRQLPDLRASSAAPVVAASDAGIAVDLGLWDGEQRSITLTTAGNLRVDRTREEIKPLDREDCNVVARSLENCAASPDCSTFASSAERIIPARWTRLLRAYHESTGLDVAAFRNLCQRSCELGLTPSFALIRQNACSGAEPGQWLKNELRRQP